MRAPVLRSRVRLALSAAALVALPACGGGGADLGPNERPVAAFDGPLNAVTGEEVTFEGSGSTDPDGYIRLWTFAWGDETPEEISRSSSASHVYYRPGLYELQLSVIDDRGDKATLVRALDISGEELLRDLGGTDAADAGDDAGSGDASNPGDSETDPPDGSAPDADIRPDGDDDADTTTRPDTGRPDSGTATDATDSRIVD